MLGICPLQSGCRLFFIRVDFNSAPCVVSDTFSCIELLVSVLRTEHNYQVGTAVACNAHGHLCDLCLLLNPGFAHFFGQRVTSCEVLVSNGVNKTNDNSDYRHERDQCFTHVA